MGIVGIKVVASRAPTLRRDSKERADQVATAIVGPKLHLLV